MGAGAPILLLIVAIVVISAVVGAIAQFLNKLNEANAPAPKAQRRESSRQTQKDMDRFLAEIDRLRRKNTENAEPTAAAPPKLPQPKPQAKPRLPLARNSNRPEKDRPRSAAEVVSEKPRRRVDSSPTNPSPMPVAPGVRTRVESLPVASIVGSGLGSTGAPAATRVTQLSAIPGSRARMDLGANFASLLTSNGIAMAVILKEVLGPPKCKG